MPLFSRRQFLAVVGLGRISAPEWKRYPDPATELEVVLLTDPAFASGMPAPYLRAFNRRSDLLLYSSERGDGTRQAYLLDLKQGDSKQITDAAALDAAALCFTPDDRAVLYCDGNSLREVTLSTIHSREVHATPEGATRAGFSVGTDGVIYLAERANGKTRVISILRQQTHRVLETDQEISLLMARPRRSQLLYRAAGQLWLANADGSGKKQMKLEPGEVEGVAWTPSGHTFTYLHVPENPKELITLREYYPDESTDRLLSKTSQFISASPNSDASVFAAASRSKASPYVLILLRVTRRELTLCEHKASDPAMVQPVFSPDSQRIVFTSDRHGKPALYLVRVNRFVEETPDQ